MYRVLNLINSEDKYCRKSSPKVTKLLWKALESMDYQKSRRQFIKNLLFNNISEFESEIQLKTIISNALADKLVEEEWIPQKGYKLKPTFKRQELINKTTNDWYCFECHSCGPEDQLIGCKCCHRSFHEKCLQKDDHLSGQPITDCDQQLNFETEEQSLNASNNQTNTESEKELNNENEIQSNDCQTIFTSISSVDPHLDFECKYCLRYKYPDNKCRSKQICGEELHKLIALFFKSIEKEFRDKDIDIYSQYSLDLSLNSFDLLFYPLNLQSIQTKVFGFHYNSFSEFENDLKVFYHNFCVVKDEDQIQPLIKAIDDEIKVLNRCFDCYLWFRAPVEQRISPKEWLVHVCDPPHRLVYAKVPGYPFWPAKVIEWDGEAEKCEVVFFEPEVRYADVPKYMVKEIDYKLSSKHMRNKNIVECVAFLFRYLKNLRQFLSEATEESQFIYEDVFKRLEGVLARKWRKFRYDFLSDLNLPELNTNTNKPKKECLKRKFGSLRDNQDFNVFNHSQYDRSQVVDSIETVSQSSDSIKENVSVLSDESDDSQMSPLNKLLSNSTIRDEDKFKICSLIISFFTDKEVIEFPDSI